MIQVNGRTSGITNKTLQIIACITSFQARVFKFVQPYGSMLNKTSSQLGRGLDGKLVMVELFNFGMIPGS